MLVHCPIYFAFSITMLWGVHQGDCSFFLHCRSIYYVACRCLCGLLHPKKKTTHERCTCFTVGNGRTRFYFLAELYLLFKMDWGLRWGFLVGFCVALYFSVSRNSVFHACTAILRLVHDFSPEGPQLVQTLGFSSALVASHLSLKKAFRFTVGNGRTRFYFLAELYLLFKMDWGLRWGFLLGFCVALYFSVSRNSVFHACTAILRLVHDFWLRKGLSLYKLWDFLPL